MFQITWQLNEKPLAEDDPNVNLSDDKRRLHILKVSTEVAVALLTFR